MGSVRHITLVKFYWLFVKNTCMCSNRLGLLWQRLIAVWCSVLVYNHSLVNLEDLFLRCFRIWGSSLYVCLPLCLFCVSSSNYLAVMQTLTHKEIKQVFSEKSQIHICMLHKWALKIGTENAHQWQTSCLWKIQPLRQTSDLQMRCKVGSY